MDFINFTGLYTKGEYDEYGYLICYMWGVGSFLVMKEVFKEVNSRSIANYMYRVKF